MNYFQQGQQAGLMQQMMGGPMAQGGGGIQAGTPLQSMFEPGPLSQNGAQGVFMPGGAQPIPNVSPNQGPNTGPIPQGRPDLVPPIYEPPGSTMGEQSVPRGGIRRFQDAGTPAQPDQLDQSNMRGFAPDMGSEDARKRLIDAIMGAAYG